MQKNYSGKKMVAVLAHPDDETFGMGGTIAHYAQNGAEVYLICTTHGEAGDVAPQYLEGYDSVAELRADELRCAAETLGIKEFYFLDHRDSGMSGSESNKHPGALRNAPLDVVAGEIKSYLCDIQPQIVMTHDPAGNYYHPDHVATHQATVKAFFDLVEEGNSPMNGIRYRPEGLYFYSFNRKRLKWLLWLMPLLGMDSKHYGRNGDIDFHKVLTMDLPVHAEVYFNAESHVQEQALRCHASQGGAHRNLSLFGRLRRLLSASREAFIQGYPTPSNGRIKHDLFEGISGESQN